MVEIERRQRKGPILTPSSLPCLRNTPSINITEGCAHGCSYCYTRGYSNYPGDGRIVLFDNTAELVRRELPRKRRRPRRVYFSPSSDAFQPVPEVLDVTYETMTVLLDSGVEIAFLTKGTIEERFLSLFSRYPAKVCAQVGITTRDERLWQAFESGAAAPARRLGDIENLARIGIPAMARLDPLIPDLTDTEENLTALLAALARRGVRDVAASYLFLRPGFAPRLMEELRRIVDGTDVSRAWTWSHMGEGLSDGLMLSPDDRRRRFARLGALAEKQGIGVHVCTCKNPDLRRGAGCQIAGAPSPTSSAEDVPLFR